MIGEGINMLCKRKAYRNKIKFERAKVVDRDKTVCNFYQCSNRDKNFEQINTENFTCRVCDILSKKLAIFDKIYYIPINDCKKIKDKFFRDQTKKI